MITQHFRQVDAAAAPQSAIIGDSARLLHFQSTVILLHLINLLLQLPQFALRKVLIEHEVSLPFLASAVSRRQLVSRLQLGHQLGDLGGVPHYLCAVHRRLVHHHRGLLELVGVRGDAGAAGEADTLRHQLMMLLLLLDSQGVTAAVIVTVVVHVDLEVH